MSELLRDVYLISESDLKDPRQAAMTLNAILNQISDRLDQLEGTRGTSTLLVPVELKDSEGNIIHGFTENS